jgi:membrane protein
MLTAWRLLKRSFFAFIEDEALTRGAAIAFYAATSIAPLLLIVISIAGMVFGREASQGAVIGQLSGLMGKQTAEFLQTTLANASNIETGTLAAIIGVVTLIATASGVFGEMQSALNVIWKVEPTGTTVSRLIWARAASLGLVGALAFLLVISLVVSAGITAFGTYLNAILPFGEVVVSAVNTIVSFGFLSLVFAAIYKVLPDRPLTWRDVALGAVITALLFTIGKSLIGWYIGSSAIASTYGAAGSLIVFLLWVYYSVQIFLFGAEITKAFTDRDTREDSLGERSGDAPNPPSLQQSGNRQLSER